jgi:hypothetical protein
MDNLLCRDFSTDALLNPPVTTGLQPYPLNLGQDPKYTMLYTVQDVIFDPNSTPQRTYKIIRISTTWFSNGDTKLSNHHEISSEFTKMDNF